jgi:tetratricopeptide (TPR) repeat protein
MHAPEPKTNDLLDKLRPSITDRHAHLSEFELRMLSRDAQRIEILSQRWSIESMIAFVKGDIDEGVRLSEKAIAQDPCLSPCWTNYATALRARGFYVREWDVVTRSLKYRLPLALSYAHTLAAEWADLERLDEVCAIIEKMELADNMSAALLDVYNFFTDKHKLLKSAGEETSSELAVMAAVVRQLAEDERLPSIVTRITHDGEGLYGLVCGVDTIDPYYLLKLDNMLFDRLIAQGIKSKNCIAFFESIAEEE